MKIVYPWHMWKILKSSSFLKTFAVWFFYCDRSCVNQSIYIFGNQLIQHKKIKCKDMSQAWTFVLNYSYISHHVTFGVEHMKLIFLYTTIIFLELLEQWENVLNSLITSSWELEKLIPNTSAIFSGSRISNDRIIKWNFIG